MTHDTDIKEKFWKSLKSDRTMFLGLAEGKDGHARPMTAQLGDGGFKQGQYDGPIWFFTGRSGSLYQDIGSGARAMAHFASKGHYIWATVHGNLSQSTDQATIDRLWKRFVAAW